MLNIEAKELVQAGEQARYSSHRYSAMSFFYNSIFMSTCLLTLAQVFFRR